MNRKERRKKGQRGPSVSPTYNLSIDQIEKIKMMIQPVLQQHKCSLYDLKWVQLGLPLMALRDEFDFGKVRLERFEDKVTKLYQSFCAGNITLGDVHKTLYEEVGLKVTGLPEDTDYKF